MKNKYSIGIIIVCIAFFTMSKILFMTKFHSIIWDEAVYIGMGKYIFSQGIVGLWETFRPYGLAFILGFFWKTGIPIVMAGDILILLFSLSTLIIVKYLFDNEFWDVLLYVTAPFFYLYSSYILTEIPSTFFLILGLYFFIHKTNYLLTGIFFALAFFFRFTHILAFIGIILFFIIRFFQKKLVFKKLLYFILGAIFVLLPFAMINFLVYYPYSDSFLQALGYPFFMASEHTSNLAEAVPGTLYNYFFYIYALVNGNWLFLVSILGLWLFFSKKMYKQEGPLLLFILLLVYFIFHTSIINKQARFLLQFLPFLVYFTSLGLKYIQAKILKNNILIFFSVVILVVLLRIPINQERIYYEWRTYEPPKMYLDYFFYFKNNPQKLPILTADPVFTAYSDELFIPYYFHVGLPKAGYIPWEENISTGTVVYSPRAFFCETTNFSCIEKKNSIIPYLEQNYIKSFEEEYFGNKYYIFTSQ
ncbi:glycosyltransferase family 39 protein [Candidatus Woesearchaeota archaeon]|nr:glycosyltransferase family 39 protein [Candidatus Woesearchaeota archaeon]